MGPVVVPTVSEPLQGHIGPRVDINQKVAIVREFRSSGVDALDNDHALRSDSTAPGWRHGHRPKSAHARQREPGNSLRHHSIGRQRFIGAPPPLRRAGDRASRKRIHDRGTLPGVRIRPARQDDVPRTVSVQAVQHYSAVGFDLDGTLFDHHESAAVAISKYVSSLGATPTPDLTQLWFTAETTYFDQWRTGHLSFAEQRRRRIRALHAALNLDCPDNDADLDAAFRRYLSEYESAWRAYPDAKELLSTLHTRGIRIGVLTNGNHDQQVDKLRRIELLPSSTLSAHRRRSATPNQTRRPFTPSPRH